MSEPKTRFDKFNHRIKNNPILASVILLGTIVIALSTFTNAAKNLLNLVITETRPDINGEWKADVAYDWLNDEYTEKFKFSGEGENVNGTASFLGLKRSIIEGTAKKNNLLFLTKSKEYLGDPGNSKSVLRRYRGKVLDGEIKFVLTIEGGFSERVPIEFIARRIYNTKNQSIN